MPASVQAPYAVHRPARSVDNGSGPASTEVEPEPAPMNKAMPSLGQGCCITHPRPRRPGCPRDRESPCVARRFRNPDHGRRSRRPLRRSLDRVSVARVHADCRPRRWGVRGSSRGMGAPHVLWGGAGSAAGPGAVASRLALVAAGGVAARAAQDGGQGVKEPGPCSALSAPAAATRGPPAARCGHAQYARPAARLLGVGQHRCGVGQDAARGQATHHLLQRGDRTEHQHHLIRRSDVDRVHTRNNERTPERGTPPTTFSASGGPRGGRSSVVVGAAESEAAPSRGGPRLGESRPPAPVVLGAARFGVGGAFGRQGPGDLPGRYWCRGGGTATETAARGQLQAPGA